MGFHTGCWLKIWEIKKTEKNTLIRVSASRKNKTTNQFEDDFTGYIRLAGKAAEMAEELREGDRIKTGFCDVTTHYDKENKKSYVNYAILEIEELHHKEDRNAPPSPSTEAVNEPSTEEDEGELPF